MIGASMKEKSDADSFLSMAQMPAPPFESHLISGTSFATP
jgi:hypothetical protein